MAAITGEGNVNLVQKMYQALAYSQSSFLTHPNAKVYTTRKTHASRYVKEVLDLLERKGLPIDIVNYLDENYEWSIRMFGPGERNRGLSNHIQEKLPDVKDIDNTAAWVSIIRLAINGAMRAGLTSHELIQELVAKQLIDEHREWPNWREVDMDKAIHPIREAY